MQAEVPIRDAPITAPESASLGPERRDVFWSSDVEESVSTVLDDPGMSRDELASKKRKVGSTNLIAAYGGAPKKRAAKACRSCGKRKIRCDVVDHGPPCSNCKFDNVPCAIATRPKRRRKLDDSAMVDVPPELGSATEMRFPIGDLRNEYLVENRRALDGMLDLSQLAPAPFSANSVIHHMPHLIYQMQSERLQNRVDGGVEGANVLDHRAPSFPVRGPDLSFWNNVVDDTVSSQNFTSINELPLFVKPLPKTINDDDVEYLWRRGALSIPELPLRKKLLHSYIEHVHGQMPILELNDFLRIVDNDYGEMGQVSLLLFQCVMFAGAQFIDLQHLRDAGFPTRLAARKALFLKARGLYDLDYEMEPMTLVQSLLLMTLWYQTPDDQKDMWYWSGVTTSLSLASGFHIPAPSHLDRKTQRLWKRIGWACFIRDQLVTLGAQRPTRVKASDQGLSMLTTADFDLEPLPWDVSCIGTDFSLARDITKLRMLAVLNIEMAKLNLCLSHVLATQYTALPHRPPSALSENAPLRMSLLLPKPESEGVKGYKECVEELDAWLSQRPAESVYSSSRTAALEDGKESIMVYRAMLDMLYNSTLIMLFGPRSFKEDTRSGDNAPAANDSQSRVRQAALEITNVAQDLLRLNILHFVPGYGCSLILTAAMTHLRGIQSANMETKSSSSQGFRECMSVLRSLRDIHPGADLIIKILEFATGKTGHSPHNNDASSTDKSKITPPNLNAQQETVQLRDLEMGVEDQLRPQSFELAGSGASADQVQENRNTDMQDWVGNAVDVHPEGDQTDSESLSDRDEAIDIGAIYFGVSEEVDGYENRGISTEWTEYAPGSILQTSAEDEPIADSLGAMLQEMEVLWRKFS